MNDQQDADLREAKELLKNIILRCFLADNKELEEIRTWRSGRRIFRRIERRLMTDPVKKLIILHIR